MFTVGILTISDRGWRGEREDKAVEVIREALTVLPIRVFKYDIVPDEREMITDKLKEWADDVGLDLILTTGGTGLAPRDVTPEATLSVLERIVPGLVEAMRVEGFKKTARALLSRGVAGTRGSCLIINLPGSPKAVRENLEVIIPALTHAIETLKGQVEECAQNEGS